MTQYEWTLVGMSISAAVALIALHFLKKHLRQMEKHPNKAHQS